MLKNVNKIFLLPLSQYSQHQNLLTVPRMSSWAPGAPSPPGGPRGAKFWVAPERLYDTYRMIPSHLYDTYRMIPPYDTTIRYHRMIPTVWYLPYSTIIWYRRHRMIPLCEIQQPPLSSSITWWYHTVVSYDGIIRWYHMMVSYGAKVSYGSRIR